jgi:hypothetical protein
MFTKERAKQMNYWVKETIKLANGPGYLDRLQEVYPVTVAPQRELSSEKRRKIEEAFEHNDDIGLIKEHLPSDLRVKSLPSS